MNSYPIQRWDVITKNNVKLSPVFYVKLDMPLLEFMRNNLWSVAISISGTGIQQYDHNTNLIADVSISSLVPNCRPNFYAQTNYLIVTVHGAEWDGYPSQMGNVKFFPLYTLPQNK
jgi:hypothetical protein